MLMPKRTKYRKTQRGKIKGSNKSGLPMGKGPAARNQHRKCFRSIKKVPATSQATRGNRVSFGEFGLQALEWCWLSSRTIEAGRVAASRAAGEGKLWIRVFPHKPVTAKPLEVRMGNGKGDVDRWVAVVRPGTVIYELGGIEESIAKKAFNRVAHKMPVRCRLITRKPI
ncbi:MAG: 50S ribosomal protein L16 [Planctomycetes bacterium]|jgi:large subunit ribosomal protein L16|nr:50S ribosomal protein L16 [Planctomycetota bacterium]NQU48629.1 50S ribosomal protein L16 [Planctomycetota bacterium]